MNELKIGPFRLRIDGNSVTAAMTDPPVNGQLAEAVHEIVVYAFEQEGVGYLVFRTTDETEEDSRRRLFGHLCQRLGLSEETLDRQGVWDTLVLDRQDGERLMAVRPEIRLHQESYMVIATLRSPEDGSKPTDYGLLTVVKEACETVFSQEKMRFITFTVENGEPWRNDLVSLFREQFGIAPNTAKDGPPRSATIYRHMWERWLSVQP